MATPKRERKPNSLMNSVLSLSRKSIEHKELRETPLENRDIGAKPPITMHIDKRFATSYDKDEVKTSRKKLYHEIKGCHLEDQVKIGIAPPAPLLKTSSNPRYINARYEENKKSFLNIFGYSPSFT
ncbi:hypothetical protein HELRODRAFT_169397 [Helobdella robusta]|uniref:Uncharacterized protein n=1 Tax=Helobdella robusta TaxID=6412 RepID=T1F1W3_HELRO|nr:hypothetical protein HELRODRAFT_169397 [Helobdella robusta]ESO08534.1 hypothetical protein HELRODRAFT_169397 [Helobdella robusta]